MKKIIRKFIKEQIKSLHEGRRVVKIYQSWKRGERANLNDLGEGNYGFDPRAIAQYFTPKGIAKEDVSVFGMSNGSVELHASSDKDKLHEAEVKGDIVNLHYKIDVYAPPSDGDMSSVIDYVENNEVVNKYNIKVEVGALESGPKEDESSVYVKFTIDRRKTAAMTAIRLLREIVIEFIEKKIGAVAVDIEARDFKPDGPSDAEYDQMAQQSAMDDRRQQGMDPGLEEAARDLGYLDEIGNFHDPRMSSGNFDHLTPEKEEQDSDVKSINMVYTDDGRFYGFNIYSEPGLKGQREKLSFRADVDDFLRSKGIKIEIPRGYDEDILDQIVNALRQQGIEAQHNDYMDVSEAYTSEWDPETAAKNQEYIKKSKKERELKAARAAFEKAEMNGDIRGQELALAAIDLIKGKRIKGLGKSSKLKEMSSELGYLEEEENLKEITVSGGQEAARNYPPAEDPGDMFAQKEVEELLPASFASRNQELKARMQAHANWAKQDRFNNTFVHFQSNTVTDGNNTYRIAMSQHYNGNYEGFKNPKFTDIRVKEIDNESDMEKDLGLYVVDTTALMQDLRKLKTIERVS